MGVEQQEALAQAKLPPGVIDDGQAHIPVMLEGDTFKEIVTNLGHVLSELLITPRNVFIIVGAWAAIWLIETVVGTTKTRQRKIHRHVAPAVAVGLCMWLVWQPGLRSYIDAKGWRYVQGAILGVFSFFTYPLLEMGSQAVIKRAKRILKG